MKTRTILVAIAVLILMGMNRHIPFVELGVEAGVAL